MIGAFIHHTGSAAARSMLAYGGAPRRNVPVIAPDMTLDDEETITVRLRPRSRRCCGASISATASAPSRCCARGAARRRSRG